MTEDISTYNIIARKSSNAWPHMILFPDENAQRIRLGMEPIQNSHQKQCTISLEQLHTHTKKGYAHEYDT